MSLGIKYAEARERWTLKNQLMDDDPKIKILSPLKVQSDGSCAFVALAVTLEANLRLQWRKNVILSTDHLRKLNEDSRICMPNERGMMKRLLLMAQSEGVFEEYQYEQILKGRLLEADARKYKVCEFRAYSLSNSQHVRDALRQLRTGGPLLAVIRISRNYHDCYRSKLVYRFDPSCIVRDEGRRPETHAVSVVSFGVGANMPFLECQDSRGKNFSRDGFLYVDVTSVKELYSIMLR